MAALTSELPYAQVPDVQGFRDVSSSDIFCRQVVQAIHLNPGHGAFIGGVARDKRALLETVHRMHLTEGRVCSILVKKVADKVASGFRDQPWLMPFTTFAGEETSVDFADALVDRPRGVGQLLLPEAALKESRQAILDYLTESLKEARRSASSAVVHLFVEDASALFGGAWRKTLYAPVAANIYAFGSLSFGGAALISAARHLVLTQGALNGLGVSEADDLIVETQEYPEGHARLYRRNLIEFELVTQGTVCA